LDLVTQGSQVFTLDFGQQAIGENRQDVPVNDVLARGTSAIGPSGMSQKCVHRRAEGLDVGHATFLAQPFSAGDVPLRRALRASKRSSRAIASENTARAVAPEGQRLAASVEAVVVAEGDGTAGRR